MLNVSKATFFIFTELFPFSIMPTLGWGFFLVLHLHVGVVQPDLWKKQHGRSVEREEQNRGAAPATSFLCSQVQLYHFAHFRVISTDAG